MRTVWLILLWALGRIAPELWPALLLRWWPVLQMEAYQDSFEHIRDELLRLDLLLQRMLLITRRPELQQGMDEFRGLIISEPEIDAFTRAKDFLYEYWLQQEIRQEELAALDQQIDELREVIDARRALSHQEGIQLALPTLGHQFELSPAEVDVLLVALAPELEPHYETLYGYLQNDVTRKRPSINLALNLICRSETEKVKARTLFASTAPLLAHRIIELGEEPHDRQPSLLRKFIKLDNAMVSFLLDQTSAALTLGTLICPEREIQSLQVDASTRTRLENLATSLAYAGTQPTFVRLVSQSEAELHAVAEALCGALQRNLILVDYRDLENLETRLPILTRDAALAGAVLGVNAVAATETEADPQRLKRTEALLWRGLQRFEGVVLLLGPDEGFRQLPSDLRVWRLEVSPPGYALRRKAWDAALAGSSAASDSALLADTFHFGADRVRQTVDMARGFAAQRDPLRVEPSTKDLLAAGRALTAPSIGRFAIKVEPRYTWSDIVLPKEKSERLRKISAWMKHRRLVHQDWGFGEKLSRGKGLIVLFTGPSGTGKTMAAEILAGELSLDLYQIDLSSVVSKYIGETEKNLSAIFSEAEQSQSLLFFDEADALFGKRTEVKDAHDRYANIEINYLLQRVEQYQGIVVLATNLQQNLDDAFLRRMQEVLEFPFPDEKLRDHIWRTHFPKNAPRAKDIDFPFLAKQFKLTGGSIKNIVLGAAFQAAQAGEPINMAHLILATKAEFQKEGKLCVKSDFGRYYELIARGAQGSSHD